MEIIKAENVSVSYITGALKNIGFKEYVMLKLRGKYNIKEFWANKNINFSLNKGDMLGIIGKNGAGKSSLLKVVSGIMRPSQGRMIINGSVAALLELASGFDGDLTVKENTYLRGAMLGYTRKFMDEKYNEIIDFAELNNFEDKPFKHLSSGMKSRLAFSIACLVQPDILILDEVLSVGDGDFRKKSGDKMKEILASGVTGILVSHSLSQVRNLCNKILWLDHGRQIEFTDDVQGCCDRYEQSAFGKNLNKGKKLIKEDYTKAEIKGTDKKKRTESHAVINKEIKLQEKLVISWKEIFKHNIKKTEWILEDNFDSGIEMVGYRYLDIMSKLFMKLNPNKILELGLFVSTNLTRQYDAAFNVSEHIIIEENQKKIQDFVGLNLLESYISLEHLSSRIIEYGENSQVRVFEGIYQLLHGKRFGFISIKAPAGGDMKEYSRIDLLSLLPDILDDRFAIMIGDVERRGEANTVRKIKEILKKCSIGYEIRNYYGDKDFVVITSTGIELESID